MTKTYAALALCIALVAFAQMGRAQEPQSSVVKGESIAFKKGERLFSNRRYPILETPESLAGMSFLRTDIESRQALSCTKTFTLYAVTAVKHPSNSLAGMLLSHGFERIEAEPFQLFGTAAEDRAGIYRKTLEPGEVVETRKWVVLLTRDQFHLKPVSTDWRENDGEVLYNGIQLPRVWPPRHMDPNSLEPMSVPYLDHPPETINISQGRQLFVDDFLIKSTDLARTWHAAERYTGNPVLKPQLESELKLRGTIYLGHGGVFFDPREGLFKMFYVAGWRGPLAVATSRDMVHWDRPEVAPGQSNVLVPRSVDDNCLWLDLQAVRPGECLKFLELDRRRGRHFLYTSADGRMWSEGVPTDPAGDYCSFFYNPFRKVWVFSIKRATRGRNRYYHEHADFLQGSKWSEAVYWTGADRLDAPEPEDRYPGAGEPTQLYSLSAVAYESLLIGLHYIHRGPKNEICAKGKFPKLTDLELGFSRDGFHWHRPWRKPFLAGTRREGDWDRAYLHSTAGVCVVLGDKLVFPYTGFSGIAPDGSRGMYHGASIGLATLRRDGFASMDAGDSMGTLTTRPLEFDGRYLFVNVDCPDGELRAELLDAQGRVLKPYTLENSEPVQADSTLAALRWKGASEVTPPSGKPVRVRFWLRNGSLYSFWFSKKPSGASGGYLAAGKLGHPSIIDE